MRSGEETSKGKKPNHDQSVVSKIALHQISGYLPTVWGSPPHLIEGYFLAVGHLDLGADWSLLWVKDGDEVYYRFPRDKKLQHLFSSYCKQKKLNYDAIAFVHDGKRVKASKTPVEKYYAKGINAILVQLFRISSNFSPSPIQNSESGQ
ncbi:UNVERIFIED_CONTAM: Small ubiquitin-related modifier 2 [Sesamum calycinum]|uniref:Small ubiquitin-related modifier 2 n=1 Tax=Sesamum calycinum TaxID=2727403 RepID=A0AAW2JIR4_9LAMI